MTAPEFLETDVVLFLHDQALREHGGGQGLRSEDLPGGALGRPVDRLACAAPGTIDPFDLAAACAFGIARHRAFNDGNERTAWSGCVPFLKVNGVGLAVLAVEAVERVVQPASGGLDEAGPAARLRSHAA